MLICVFSVPVKLAPISDKCCKELFVYMLCNYVHVQPTNQPQSFSSHCQGSTDHRIRTPDRTASDSCKFAHAQI